MTRRKRLRTARRAASLGALFVLVCTAGMTGSTTPEEIEVVKGEARVEGGVLFLEPDTVVTVGEGRRLEISVVGRSGAFDILHGEPETPWHFAHFSERVGLYDETGTPLPGMVPMPWSPGPRILVGLECSPPLHLLVGGREFGLAESTMNHRCTPGPLSVRSVGNLRVDAMSLDGAEFPVDSEGFAIVPGLVSLVSLVPPILVFGLGGWWALGGAPMVPYLAAARSIPSGVTWWVLALSALAVQAFRFKGWRRRFASALTMGGVLLGLGMSMQEDEPVDQVGSAPTAKGYARGLLFKALETKVERGLELVRPHLDARPRDKPLVLVLGSSSSGGLTEGSFWPQQLQAQVPDAHVVTLAIGGFTSWHLRRAMQELGVQADVCVAYAGHNDRIPNMPGASIAELEKGAAAGVKLVPAVSLPEAKVNHAAISEQCGTYLGMEERVVGSERRMQAYAEMLRNTEGVEYLDVSSTLEKYPDSEVMLDDVHPSPEGQAVIAARVAERVREILDLEEASP